MLRRLGLASACGLTVLGRQLWTSQPCFAARTRGQTAAAGEEETPAPPSPPARQPGRRASARQRAEQAEGERPADQRSQDDAEMLRAIREQIAGQSAAVSAVSCELTELRKEVKRAKTDSSFAAQQDYGHPLLNSVRDMAVEIQHREGRGELGMSFCE